MSFRRDRSSRRTGGFLKPHDEQLVRLGRLAERYFPEDPNTCLLKLRQLSELLAQLTATRVGSYVSTDEKQFELLQRLEREKILMREVMKELTSRHACGICHVPC